MLQCWKANPLERPSFTQLAEQLGVMLEDNIRRVSGIGDWFLPLKIIQELWHFYNVL